MRREKKKAERPAELRGGGGEGLEEELYPSERLEIILDYETMRNNLITDFCCCCCLTEARYDIWILLQDDGKAGGGLGVGRP